MEIYFWGVIHLLKPIIIILKTIDVENFLLDIIPLALP